MGRTTVIDRFRLNDKVAVLTGGAGLYGRQLARGLAEAGARTILASRNVEALDEQAKPLRDEGYDVTATQLDQSDEASVNRLLKHVLDTAGRCDVLVNNAVLRPMKDWSSPAADFAKSMAVNATGVFMMTRAFGDHMAERGGGSIVNIGSMQGMIGPDYTLYEGLGWGTPPDYFFHKGGMIQLTRFAASKLGPRNVRVNCISPGGFLANQGDVFIERYNRRTFLGRMANDTDLVGAVVFLASEAASYITGANLVVDGGYTAK